MSRLGMKIGVYVIVAALTVVGAVFVISKVGLGAAVVFTLAVIGACNLLDWFSEWLIEID